MHWRPFSFEPRGKGRAVRIHWLPLGIIGLILTLGLWFAATCGVWIYVKYHREFPGVRYVDLLLPSHWPAYRISEGNFYITRAEHLLQKGEPDAALFQLRTGLAKAPANARGRTTLASLYLAGRRPDLARELLLDGLRYLRGDPAYLQSTLSFLLELQEDAQVMTVAEGLLATPGRFTNPSLVATFAATAAYHLGNYDRAEDLIAQHHLHDTPEGATLLARIEWDRGYPELALLRLHELLGRQPGLDGARTQLASYYRDLGRTEEMAAAIVARLVSDPLAPAPRIAHLYLHHQRDDQPRLARDTEVFLDQFQHDTTALLLLGDFAASTGQPALARRVQQVFVARREENGAAALMVAESHLVAGEYSAALTLIDDYARDYPGWTRQFAAVFNGLQAVALCGLGKKDEARLQLDHLLAQKNLRADNLVAIAHRLSARGARELARAALGRAVENDPHNQAALTHLLRLELDTGNVADLPAHLERYLGTRQPSREILARAYATLGSDRHIFLPAQPALLGALRQRLAAARP